MRKNYLILVVAHSVHGRIRRVHIPHYAIHVVLSLALFGAIVGIGFLSSYARMLWKVAEYNSLRDEKQALQRQNEELKRTVEERNTQLASLGTLATEVSIAFGIKRPESAEMELRSEDIPNSDYQSFVDRYDFLQRVHTATVGDQSLWYLENTTPSLWPVRGSLSSSFGNRRDPFSGEGAFHPGVDLRSRRGVSVVATADGVVHESGWAGQYGKRVILNHGRSRLSTHYAHLSEFYVRPGQTVRRGQVIGRVGGTGRVTSPHLHYEVRYRGTPVNPYKYLQKSSTPTLTFQRAD
jgi:murein DD-endopeptidase MepM/ murein hydrolase activator NlpD